MILILSWALLYAQRMATKDCHTWKNYSFKICLNINFGPAYPEID